MCIAIFSRFSHPCEVTDVLVDVMSVVGVDMLSVMGIILTGITLELMVGVT